MKNLGLVKVPESEMKSDFEKLLVKQMRYVSEHGQQDIPNQFFLHILSIGSG